ncbi:hypothetical protein C4572_04330 [Candidatus Parcubacteria bacterium]|nr:MAG: hypothetical protein C4572_04330 [Candidatus Parcubacteria bacterium]
MIKEKALAKAIVSLVKDDGFDQKEVARKAADFLRKENFGTRSASVSRWIEREMEERETEEKIFFYSAEPLNDRQIKKAAQLLDAPEKTRHEVTIDGKMAAGFKAMWKGKMIDLTAAGQVKLLKKAMTNI